MYKPDSHIGKWHNLHWNSVHESYSVCSLEKCPPFTGAEGLIHFRFLCFSPIPHVELHGDHVLQSFHPLWTAKHAHCLITTITITLIEQKLHSYLPKWFGYGSFLFWSCRLNAHERDGKYASIKRAIITGYNQSVTGCGSQRRHVVVTQRKLM